MNLGYIIVVIFGCLTVYYVWNDYKKDKMSKKTFVSICAMEAVVVIVSLVSLLKSFL